MVRKYLTCIIFPSIHPNYTKMADIINNLTGWGKIECSNGEVYDGEFIDGRAEGNATFTRASGAKYVGKWKNGNPNGKGREKCPDGAEYEGDWVNGMSHGYGAYKWNDGSTHTGEWRDHKPHGKGEAKFVQGNVYRGVWENGERHGTFTVEAPSKHVFRQIYHKGELVRVRVSPNPELEWSEQCATLINIPPYQHFFDDDEIEDIVRLNDEQKACIICFNRFSADMSNTNDIINRHLPVLSKTCDHWYCHGCILDAQAAGAESNRVPEWIPCLGCCIIEDAFCPSKPNYHRLLIDLLHRSIPIITEKVDALGNGERTSTEILTNNHTSASKGTTASPSKLKSANNDDGQVSKINSSVKLSKKQKRAKCEGDWENCKLHGYGTYKGNDGIDRITHTGEWRDGKQHGKGESKFGQGNVYRGVWENGEQHGTFTMKTPRGNVFKQVYNQGILESSVQCATLINIPPYLHIFGNDDIDDIVRLNDEHKACIICFNQFSSDTVRKRAHTSNINDIIKRHLPVLSKTCDHWYCHGCILDAQAAGAENGIVNEWIRCLGCCRTEDAFCPSKPNYHRLLIDLLHRSIPIIAGKVDALGTGGSTSTEILTNNHTSSSKGTTASPSNPKSANNDDGQMSKIN
jgi:hypothetical protein